MTAPHPPVARSGHDLRVLRAAVFAAVCVVLAAAGHTLASGAGIPLWALGAGLLGVAVVAAPLAGRERSLPGIAALLAAGQLALHTLFGLGQHGGTAVTATARSAGSLSDASLIQQAARLMCGTTAAAISPAQAERILTDARVVPDAGAQAAQASAAPASGAVSLAAHSSESLLPSLSMLLGHVLAAAAAGWLLRRGDLALARLVELSAQSAHAVAEETLVRSLRGALALVRALSSGLPDAPECGLRGLRTTPLAPPAPRNTALQHTVIRRGPPATVFALAA
ncbi:hypothetical protein [Streptomyces poriticola]|uniref:hypothetical protein n=1 Tax=Streptomyces poriticola TaxID=3120506 RepID=UPI002FCE2B4E